MYLAKGKNKRSSKSIDETAYDLESIPLLYKNERQVRILKGSNIDKGVIRDIVNIEKTVYREQQRQLEECGDYVQLAESYGMDPDNVQISI